MKDSLSEENWVAELREYCRKLNIEIEDLPKILLDPKVTPMIRGKAFEFSLSLRLSRILPSSEWLVSKPKTNAQTGSHDVDVKVFHKPTGKVIRVECKLTDKGGFRVSKTSRFRIGGTNDFKIKKGDAIVSVKCMRSRTTLSAQRVKSSAESLGLPESVVSIHSDQYRTRNFEIVATSLANAFYETNKEEMIYEFKPTAAGRKFIERMNPPADTDLQTFVYNKIYLAKTDDLIVSERTGIVCGRKKCLDKTNCEFIPNHPLINFGDENATTTLLPTDTWIELSRAQELFEGVLKNNPKLLTEFIEMP